MILTNASPLPRRLTRSVHGGPGWGRRVQGGGTRFNGGPSIEYHRRGCHADGQCAYDGGHDPRSSDQAEDSGQSNGASDMMRIQFFTCSHKYLLYSFGTFQKSNGSGPSRPERLVVPSRGVILQRTKGLRLAWRASHQLAAPLLCAAGRPGNFLPTSSVMRRPMRVRRLGSDARPGTVLGGAG